FAVRLPRGLGPRGRRPPGPPPGAEVLDDGLQLLLGEGIEVRVGQLVVAAAALLRRRQGVGPAGGGALAAAGIGGVLLEPLVLAAQRLLQHDGRLDAQVLVQVLLLTAEEALPQRRVAGAPAAAGARVAAELGADGLPGPAAGAQLGGAAHPGTDLFAG